MKLKPLLPSLREKKRYIAFEVQTESELSLAEARESIEATMHGFLGDLGMARAGVLFLKDWKQQRGIIRVNTKHVDDVKAAFALVQEVAKHKAKVQSLAVSGAIGKIRESYF